MMDGTEILQSGNPFILAKAAAGGSLQAQRALAGEAAPALFEGDIGGFYEGLTYARMAATSGGLAGATFVERSSREQR